MKHRSKFSYLAFIPILLATSVMAQPGVHIVNQSGLSFVPQDITITAGETVSWAWSSGIHTVTNGFGAADPNAGTHFDAPLEQQLNPDVTVRGPGVMEKCTFCIQRIRRGEENAHVDGRNVADGEVVPACAQACPSNALVFGDQYDEESRVSKMIPDERQFKLLENMGTEPSVYYLKGGESNVGE